MQKQFPPAFSELMAQYRDTAAGLGDQHPHARRLLQLAMQLAPDWFVDEMHQMAREMDLIPEPCACDDDGQKFYSVDAIAQKLGVPVDEARAAIDEMQADAAALGLPSSVRVKDVTALHPLH